MNKADAARAADGKRPALAMRRRGKAPLGEGRRPRRRGRRPGGSRRRAAPTRRRRAGDEGAAPPIAPSVTPQPPPKPREAARITAPTLPLPDPEPIKAPAERRKGDYTLPPLALLDADPRRAQDRRAPADGRGAPARGQVPRVLGRGQRRPDSPGPGRHDLRAQARRRREIQQDHRPLRRSVAGDEGRVGADRSHPRQVDRRHPDPERRSRADLAARDARVGAVPEAPARS